MCFFEGGGGFPRILKGGSGTGFVELGEDYEESCFGC